MVRSVLTRLSNSLTGVVLLIPCLLIGLACATPFPIENLEKGMTAETVREKFGAPESVETEPGGVGSSWTYVDEELDPDRASFGWFLAPFFAAVSVFSDWEWDDPYMRTKDVVLHFRWESEGPTPARYSLAGWEVIRPVFISGYAYSPAWQQQQPQWTWQQMEKDIKHHKKGHKHHQGKADKWRPAPKAARNRPLPEHTHENGPRLPAAPR